MYNGKRSDTTWQRWDFPSSKTSVFVIRGTSTTYDALQDVALYAMSSAIELVSFGWSLKNVIPDIVLHDLVDIVSNDDFEINTHFGIKNEIERFIQIHPKNEWSTIVVGHSLGGSYANILAALLEIPSFTLSPPGLQYISRSLQINQKRLELAKSYSMSILPQWDLVTRVDHIIGTTVQIPCTVDFKGTTDLVKCHSPMRTLSTLIMACPDNTHPTRIWSLAENFYDRNEMVWYFSKDHRMNKNNNDYVKWPYKWRENDGSDKKMEL